MGFNKVYVMAIILPFSFSAAIELCHDLPKYPSETNCLHQESELTWCLLVVTQERGQGCATEGG
jgi:hypothetical protein